MKEQHIINLLSRNSIRVIATTVYIRDYSTVGIKTYGKIDFLRNHCNFTVVDERSHKANFPGIYQ